MAGSLKKLEEQLAREAAAFGAHRARQPTDPRHAMWKICGLTGLAPTVEGFHAKAAGVLRQMLAAQRRWARMAHPAYDLNRHLSIREALATLEDGMCGTTQNGTGRMPGRTCGP